jgi:zinc protease
MKKTPLRNWLWLGLVGFTAVGFAQIKPLPKPVTAVPQKITSVEGITEYRLANGLQVLLFPDPSKQSLTVNITYLVGSRNENYGETGMAHLLEHLVFKGTPKHPNIPQELTTHGCRPNGTTWLDRTNYFETMNASDENLDWALDLEADRMVNSYIAKKDLVSEMTVVRNEFESGENQPSGILMERVMSTAYLWHNYGNTTIGARADIEKVPIERLQAFYRNYYQPDNAVLLVAGKFDEAKTLALINRKFGNIPKPKRTLQATYTEEPTQDGERLVTLRRTGDVQVVAAAYHIPNGYHPDFPAIEILQGLLTDEPAGKLYKALIDNKKASFVYGYNFQTREPGLMYFTADVVKEKSLDSARNIMTETIESFAKTLPAAEEVDRIRTKQLKDIELALNSAQRVGLTLSEYVAMGDWRLFFYLRDQYKKITPEDVQRVARQYLKPSNRTLGLYYPTPQPDRSEVPPVPDLQAMLKDFKGSAVVAQGEAFDTAPANVESRTQRSQAGSVKMALLSRKTRGASVFARMTLRFGDENSLKGKYAVPALTASMLNRGTAKKTRQQIQDEIDKLKAKVSVFGSAGSVGINVETNRENLPQVLKLLNEILREPAFPADEFEKLRQENISGQEQQKSDPQAKAFEAINRHLNPYPKDDPRYTSTADEAIANLKSATLEQVKQFYKDFYGASDATFAASGDFDEAEIKTLVGQLFGNWKSPKPFARLTDPYRDIAPVNEKIETPDKANAMFFGGLNLNLDDNDPDFPALFLGNEIMGGGFLNSRLATRIRQKDGISYGVGSYFSADELDKKGYFGLYAIYAPENLEKLEKAFQEEIEKMVTEGFTAKEVEEAKKGALQQGQIDRSNDNYLARTLNSYLYYNRTFKWDENFEKKLAALSPAQVNAAIKKHIDPKKISFAKAGDFNKKKPAK